MYLKLMYLVYNIIIFVLYCDRNKVIFYSILFYSIYTTIGELSSKFEDFLAVRSQFDSGHGVDFSAPTCCQSATFVRPLFFTEKTNK